MLKHRIIFLTAVIAAILCIIIYTSNRAGRIGADAINAYTAENVKDPALRSNIIKSVLTTAGTKDFFTDAGNVFLDIRTINIRGKENDLLFIMTDGQKSYLAVYEKKGTDYKFLAEVDTFMALRDVQIMPLREQSGGVIVVREYADQLDGAYEAGTFIRGYAVSGNNFSLVLNVVENYKSYYNQMWDEYGLTSEKKWERMMERADILWENELHPLLNVLVHQSYALSDDVNTSSVPNDKDFDIINIRDVKTTYYWSGKWMHFIIFEGYDSKKGEAVAVIEDLSNSPIALAEDYDSQSGKYRVKYKNGRTEIVDKSRISKYTGARKLKIT